jgi:MYXO-CTERM domain-containing protein
VLAVRRTAPLLVALGLVLVARQASAACNRPDLLDAVPPDGAVDVPTNASLYARYSINADYLGETITLSHDGTDEDLTGSWDAAELLLSVTPTLQPNTEYTITWPKLRGVNSANLGRNKVVTFTVGDQPDTLPPIFDGLSSVDFDVDREKDECTDNLEDRYTFDFQLGHAEDDGGRDSLLFLLFQTKGPFVTPGVPKPVLAQRLPKPGSTLRLTETIADGAGDVCFQGLVRDLTGKASAGGSKELCLHTEEPPFFNGCSTAPGRAPGAPLASLFAVLGLAVLRRSRPR